MTANTESFDGLKFKTYLLTNLEHISVCMADPLSAYCGVIVEYPLSPHTSQDVVPDDTAAEADVLVVLNPSTGKCDATLHQALALRTVT
jgi:hypothetical protein